jgi:tetratricopeptide (TPR) repeat protein
MAFDKRKAFQNALTFAQQSKWDKAIAEYQAILKADPHDLTACNNLGDLYARLGKATEAIEQYLKLGELFRADGLAVKAIAVYKKIVKLAPTRIDVLLACADLYEEQGLTGEAKIQLAAVAEHYGKAGKTDKLVDVYQRLAQLDPTNHVLITKLGDLLLREGKRDAAATQYEMAAQAAQAAGQATETNRLLKKVRELRPDSPGPSLELAEAKMRDGRHAEAVEALAGITSADARNGEAWRLLGEAYGQLGQAPEAVAALEKAVALGVSMAKVRHPMATALVQAGRTEEGMTLCRQIVEEALSRSEPDEAVALCQGILTVAPHLTPMHAYMADLLEGLGRSEEARAATWALAAAHEAAGETETAIQVYHRLLERDPSDTEAQARLDVLQGAPAAPPQVPPPAMESASLAEPVPETVAEDALVEFPADSVTLEAVPIEKDSVPLAAEPIDMESAPLLADSVPLVGEEPELILQEAAPEGPPTPDLSLSIEEVQTLLDEPSLVAREELETELRPQRAFELDEGGVLAGVPYETQQPAGGSLDRMAMVEETPVEFPGEERAEAPVDLEALAAEEEAAGEVAEQLAEAEVYLKYGLTEKARERLLEVVRLTPENLTAHLRLKDLYLERSQNQEACWEIVAIARILDARAHGDAALAVVREGLSLAPQQAELQDLAAKLSGGVVAPAERPAARPPAKPPAAGLSAEPIDEGEQSFDIPEPAPPPEDLDLAAGIGAPLEQAAPAEAIPGLDDVAVPGLEDLEVPGLDVVPPEKTAPALEPVVEAMPAGGGEIEVQEDLDKLLAEPVLAGSPTSVPEEALPAELHAFLEESGSEEEPALVTEDDEANLDQAMADDLAEAEFYLAQGMAEEARAVYQRMRALAPEHPAVVRLALQVPAPPGVSAEAVEPSTSPEEAPSEVAASPEGSALAELFGLSGSETGGERPLGSAPVGVDRLTTQGVTGQGPQPPPPPAKEKATEPPPARVVMPPVPPQRKEQEAEPPAPSGPKPVASPAPGLPLDQLVTKFSVQDAERRPGDGGFVNLGAELEEELAAEEGGSAGPAGGPLVEDLLKEFQKGVREHLDEKDFETHYNLGIAYKEMQLYDEAIEAFRLAGRDPGRTLTCANLMGLCFLAKGEAEAAIRELRAGLDIRGYPREAYQALRYDLGAAYDTAGDLERALEVFESLMAENERFRDVRSRVKGLRERVQQQRAAAVPAEAEAPPPPAKSKKKISFI